MLSWAYGADRAENIGRRSTFRVYGFQGLTYSREDRIVFAVFRGFRDFRGGFRGSGMRDSFFGGEGGGGLSAGVAVLLGLVGTFGSLRCRVVEGHRASGKWVSSFQVLGL